MSYILDALRKSEQERLRGQPLSTLSHSPIGDEHGSRPRWLVPLLAGNLLLVTVLAVWWLRGAAVSPDTPTPAVTPTTPAVVAPVATTPVSRTEGPAAPEAAPIDPPPAAEIPNAAYEGVGDWQADDAAGWPALALSTHVYSSAPAARSVIINGMRLSEGDVLDSGVKVEEITDTGARLSWRGQERQLDITR